jgi:hypothetical protein
MKAWNHAVVLFMQQSVPAISADHVIFAIRNMQPGFGFFYLKLHKK